MLEVKIEQASVLKKIVDIVQGLVKDCNFDFSQEGLYIEAVDSSHILLSCILLGSEGFSEYRCDRDMTIGINMQSLQKVLRCAKNDDIVTIRAEQDPKILSLTFEEPKQGRISEFNLKLMTIDQERFGIPEIEFEATAELPSSAFQRVVRDLFSVSDSGRIEIDKDGLRFSSEGDSGDCTILLKNFSDLEEQANSVSTNVTNPTAQTYNLKYFTEICKSGDLSERTTIQLEGNSPAKITYRLPSGYVRYFLAPKIED